MPRGVWRVPFTWHGFPILVMISSTGECLEQLAVFPPYGLHEMWDDLEEELELRDPIGGLQQTATLLASGGARAPLMLSQ